jgi:fructose-1,6-bisphosphatase I
MKFSVVAFAFTAGAISAFAPVKPAFSRVSSFRLFSVVEEPLTMNRPGARVPVFDEVCDTTGVTLTRFMSEVAMLNPDLSELTTLFGAIDTACKAISSLVKRSQLPSSSVLGYQGNVNVQGEDQKVSLLCTFSS